MNKKLGILAAAAAIALGLTGCSASSDGGSTGADGDFDPNAVITVLDEIDTDSLDPQQVTSIHAAAVLSHIYDTLVVQSFDKKSVEPGLAESWEVSDDGLEYTFTLKPGVKFHSGKELTADDVIYTLNRWMDESKPSPTAVNVQGISEMEAPDAQTVKVTLTSPNVWFLENLSLPWSSILNEEAASADDYGQQTADGTGPFIVEEWNPGDTLQLVRNEDYAWGPAIFENTGPAHVAGVTFKVVPEASTRVASLTSGEADLVPWSSNLLPSLDQLQSDPNIEVAVYDLPNLQFLNLKIGKEQTADAAVRQALNMAVDKQSLVDVIQNGLGQPANSFLHPDMKYAWADAEANAYSYDPEGANELLDESGWVMGSDNVRSKNGTKLTLEIYAGTGSEQELTLVQSDFAKIGVQANLNLVDRTALYDIRRTETPDVNAIYLPMENADVLRTYFSCPQMPSPNRSNFCDEEFDALLQKGLESSDEAEAEQAYADAQKILHEQALVIPEYHRQEFMSYRSDLKDVKPYPQYGIALFKSLDLKK